MAIVESLTGNIFLGRTGEFISYRVRDKIVMRRHPRHLKKKGTPLQNLNRQRFSQISHLYRVFRHFIYYRGLDTLFDKRRFFMNHNMGICKIENGAVTVRFQDIYLTNRTCAKLSNLSVVKIGRRFVFSWSLDFIPDESFKVLAWVYSQETGQVYYCKTNRSEITATVLLNYDIPGEFYTGCFGFRE